ncbi:helix-turn-helix transcriptional regulator [Rhizobium indicum]|uniref:Helix-turn-helix transcriptional regulator n=1 Tax=Rhizobium indicum TaxID=2583231 RepID=A0ABX6PJ10_9HYPH|nr:helix-turn-helix transcriptional regulator [Rhizobium indicum]QKK19047.1 helix-turn-helix transcriptional regulator [Rhizobium indicum]
MSQWASRCCATYLPGWQFHRRPSHAWTLEDLARKAGMYRTSFAQYFPRRVGETPISYVARRRMMSAGTKLIQGEETMAEISVSLGYSSEHAFSTAFKRIMEQSPLDMAEVKNRM